MIKGSHSSDNHINTAVPRSTLHECKLLFLLLFSMTASTLSPPAITDALRPPNSRNPSRSIAACIDSSRPKIPGSNPVSYNSSTVQIVDSLCHWPELADQVSDDYVDDVWSQIREEALSDTEDEPILARYYSELILRHESLESALSNLLSMKLSIPNLLSNNDLRELFAESLVHDDAIGRAVRADLRAAFDRDPASSKMVHYFLYYKGFHACQAHRVAHWLWITGRRSAALLIQSRSSEAFAVDIHPRARIGSGIFLGHATGVVIGETAVVGDNVSILHNVTLGGTGKDSGDRHPKICDGVLVGPGTQILGNVKIWEGAKVGAGSVVLKDVPPMTTAVGSPARLLGGKENPIVLDQFGGLNTDHTSWSDFVI
ncbi:hypothetical protein HPP92_019966 [Vanilla planifolia]|uniref:serine O-acetyltransferase n=1 Tax=Vanilla planifolia TaxID=51239 RepID=A0A835UL92_VANPL|nr:hypothetical protein HPP92_019966 [Vanilla planifolia]